MKMKSVFRFWHIIQSYLTIEWLIYLSNNTSWLLITKLREKLFSVFFWTEKMSEYMSWMRCAFNPTMKTHELGYSSGKKCTSLLAKNILCHRIHYETKTIEWQCLRVLHRISLWSERVFPFCQNLIHSN